MVFVILPEGEPITLDAIRSSFDSAIDRIDSDFIVDIDKLVSSLINTTRQTIKNPESANDIITRVSSEFSIGVGDSTSGIYGSFSVSINDVIQTTSNYINTYAKNNPPHTQSELDVLQSQIDSLSQHISDKISDVSNLASDHVSSASDRFSSALNDVVELVSVQYVNQLYDSCSAGIKRSTERAMASINSLLSLLRQYKMVPSSVYEDTNNILSNIYTDYNNDLNDSLDAFNNGISSFSYHTISSQSVISSASVKIDHAVQSSSLAINQLSAKIGEVLSSVSPYVELLAVDYVVFSVVAKKIDELYVETIRVRNKIDSIMKDVLSDAEVVRIAVERQFKNTYKPIYVDGSRYRDAKSLVLSGVYEVYNSGVQSLQTKFTNVMSPLSNNISNYSSDLQTAVIDYVNDKIPNLPAEQVDIIATRFGVASTRSVNRVSSYISQASLYMSYVLDSLSKHLERLVRKYYDLPALLQYTGSFESPLRLSSVDSHTLDDGTIVRHNIFSFSVRNIGKTNWIGWFGVKLVSTVDYDDYAASYLYQTGEEFTGDYTPPYFIWNKRVGLVSILANDSYRASIAVPGNQIFNIKNLGAYVTWNVIVNTHKGVQL